MNIGHRVFFVLGEEVTRISQRKFSDFYLKELIALPEHAKKTVLSVVVFYELSSRKPFRVLRIDTQKIRFDANGGLDKNYEKEEIRLISVKMNELAQDVVGGGKNDTDQRIEESQNNIIDASSRFDERQWSQRHPELSGPLLKRILDAVFGPSS